MASFCSQSIYCLALALSICAVLSGVGLAQNPKTNTQDRNFRNRNNAYYVDRDGNTYWSKDDYWLHRNAPIPWTGWILIVFIVLLALLVCCGSIACCVVWSKRQGVSFSTYHAKPQPYSSAGPVYSASAADYEPPRQHVDTLPSYARDNTPYSPYNQSVPVLSNVEKPTSLRLEPRSDIDFEYDPPVFQSGQPLVSMSNSNSHKLQSSV